MPSSEEADRYAALRRRMVDRDLRARGISDARVLDAMVRVPRHEFVPMPYRDQAYEDHPLPIGDGQTISQPYIVAIMLEALQLDPADEVLEVGTGSGYVTALLAELTAQVLSVERHAALAESALEVLASLGYSNVRIVVADGSQGFPECAPYDAIMVSAAALTIPQALLDQLGDSGRMIIPVGAADAQQLQLVRMHSGEPQISLREPCRFVPLISSE
jgi:protein-L-isoaspartate(D-aspartate) O-methyltransferase